MGRKKLWPERITLPLTTDLKDQIDAVLEEEETRLDLIRYAIEIELQKRRKKLR